MDFSFCKCLARHACRLIVVALVFGTGCQKTTQCIDERQIDPSVSCTGLYAPVCGCDNVTYSNECVAQKSGVVFWTEGACVR